MLGRLEWLDMPKNKYSHSATLVDLKKVVRSFIENYQLIGGYALFSHGCHSTNKYIDLFVPDDARANNVKPSLWYMACSFWDCHLKIK